MSALAFSAARPARIAIAISGRGSNMGALAAACAMADAPARIVLVVSDQATAAGLAHATAAGLPTRALPGPGRGDREAALDAALRETQADLLCLAGFMRILSADFLARWPDRVLNIHPSLLPAYPGLETHARAIADGVRLHGATVHLARPAVDAGPILGQAALAAAPDENAEQLGARVLRLEHQLYPACLFAYATGALTLQPDGRVAGWRPTDLILDL